MSGRVRPRPRAAAPPAPPALPLRHPAMLAGVLLSVATILLFVTYALFEPDFWQHLLVGRVVWETRAVPDTQLWSWPTYGAPEVTPSWLFRALVWPFWSLGEVPGLFVWRWLTTLAAFGLLAAAARRMGARGFAALGVLVLCALAYRSRATVRPETLVAVLLALEVWILETRRSGGRDHAPWLAAVVALWANAHISYYLGLLIPAAYLADDLVRRRAGARRLAAWIAVAVAAAFANPFGWRALWQPFDFLLHMRREPLLASIDELRPFAAGDLLAEGRFLLLAGWPALQIARVAARRADVAGLLLCGVFTALALSGQRFFGTYALVAAPFVMRDLSEWVAGRGPALTPVVRLALLGLFCAGFALGELRRGDPRAGVTLDASYFPVRACDYLADHGVRGRIFNHFYEGGYLLWRFWPDRGRLPFMDIHTAGGPEVRADYWAVFTDPRGFGALEARYRPDILLLDRRRNPRLPFLDRMDADTSWALVFADDAAALYLRRDGPHSELAARDRYRHLPAGQAALGPLGQAVTGDSLLRAAVRAELERQRAASPFDATAASLLANVALLEGRYDEARALLEHARGRSVPVGRIEERLGLVALAQGRARDAQRHFERERALDPRRADLAVLLGRAAAAGGERGRAADWYRRALALDPGSAEARDSLAALAPGAR